MATTIVNGIEIGPDGKEWAKTEAGYAHVEKVKIKADGFHGLAPWFYGHAVRDAFVAGAEWQEKRNPYHNAPPFTSISYDTALEHWNDRSNGADEGRSTSKGGRAWLSGEFQLCELEALCIVLRHEAGEHAEGIAELLHNIGPAEPEGGA